MRPAVSRMVGPLLTSPRRRNLARGLRGLPRALGIAAPTVEYFHQVDDPYSHLAAQLLAPLAERYGLRVRAWLVGPPNNAAAPERARLKAYALRDAPRVAAEYGLSFPSDAASPDAQEVAWANAALAGVANPDDVPAVAVEVGTALWGGDRERLRKLAGDGRYGSAAVAAGNAERSRLGHYLSAMLYFEGEWYWGVDRLNHLEERLAALGLDSKAGEPPIAAYRDTRLAVPPPGAKKATIEVWFSFRSPYSWIAFPRLRELAHHNGAELRLRYILPMVMRGLPVPRIKSTYILLDTKREAERAGLPFGRMVDPVGVGVERTLAVLHHAVPLGMGEEFAEQALRAAFAEGVDLAQDAGLYAVARAAGLEDAQTAAALADPSWRETAEENRVALLEAGLWGAPTYRVDGGPALWGQDRLWALEQDLLAATSQ